MNKATFPKMGCRRPERLAILSIILTAACSFCVTPSEGCGIAVYWGRNSSEGSLREACDSGLYAYVNIAFLHISGENGSVRLLDLDGHCSPFIDCHELSREIAYCQSIDIKVLLSLSGGVSNSDRGSATELAQHLWDWYLGGESANRPLGDIPLDGIDFAVTQGSPIFYYDLAWALYNYSTAESKVYLSASPRCPHPENSLDVTLRTGLFDYVWVQFYNNTECDGTVSNVVSSWFRWSTSISPASQLFLGLPASPSAVQSGYVPPDQFVTYYLPWIKDSRLYGGVMIWNRYFDLNYTEAIRGAVCDNTIQQHPSRAPKESLISQVI